MARPKDEENASQIRNRILDVAEKLFAKKGFDATGIAEIASRAKVTKSLIYYYFRNKEALLTGIAGRFQQDAMEMKRRVARPALQTLKATDREAFAAFIADQSLPFLERHRDAIMVGLVEEMRDPSEGPLFEFMRSSLEAALPYYDEAGISLRDRTDFAAYALFMLSFPMLAYAVLGKEWCVHSGADPKQTRALISRWITDALMQYLRGGSSF